MDWAVAAFRRKLTHVHVSGYFETEPEGVPDAQPPYLNAAAIGRTDLSPQALLQWLLELEGERGRRRDTERAARTLDLDLILYGDVVIEGPALVVPHPRFRSRRFVLEPLAQIDPGLRDPVSGRTIGELLADLP